MNNVILISFLLFILSIFYFIYFLYIHKQAVRRYENLIFNQKGEFINVKSSIETLRIPIIKAEIEGKKYNFIVDSGSDRSLIFKSILDSIKDKIYLEKGVRVTTINDKTDINPVCRVYFSIKNNVLSDDFIELKDSVSFTVIEDKYDIKIDGILGGTFLIKNRWIIDYDNLVVWVKNKDK
jgi:hypothetical protein